MLPEGAVRVCVFAIPQNTETQILEVKMYLYLGQMATL